MKKTIILKASVAATVASTMLLSSVAFAQTNVSAGASIGVEGRLGKNRLGATTTASTTVQERRMEKGKTVGDKEIDVRIDSLAKLQTRISDMKNLSANEKAALSAKIQSLDTNLTTLKAKIDSDTDPVVLKADRESITKSYRVYALVIPQVQILAAADRLTTVVSMLGTVGDKIQARLTKLQSANIDVTSAQTAYADFTTQLNDAKVQIKAAQDLVVNLQPDNGNKDMASSTKNALVSARAAINAALKDVKTARQDLGTIVAFLKDHPMTSVTATSTASTTVQ